MTNKRLHRQRARGARRQLSPADRTRLSQQIAARVSASRYFFAARAIACYLPMPEEVDTWPIIERAWRMRKRVFAPVIGSRFRMRFLEVRKESTLSRNDFGLLEPAGSPAISPSRLDLVLTPLVAFDANRNRIGMGGGYYDRAFSFLKLRRTYLRPKLAGLAFACQEVERIDASPWDVPLFRIYTEHGEVAGKR